MKMSEEQRKLCEDNLPLAYWYARKWAAMKQPLALGFLGSELIRSRR